MTVNSLLAVALTSLTLATTTPLGGTVIPSAPCVSIVRSLALGNHGDDVAQLQVSIGLKPTGYFGHVTQDALVRWQISKRIIRSKKSSSAGILGPRSKLLLSCKLSPSVDLEKNVAPKMPSIIATSTAPVVSSSSVLSIPVILPITNSRGGGGGSSPTPSNSCKPFTTPKPKAACTTAVWTIIEDEAGCPIQWDCSDPNATE